MRRLRWPLLIVWLLPSIAAAQASKRQIAALEDDWIKAVVKRDARAFDRLLTNDFVYTENDRVYSKAELVKEVTTGSDTVTSGRNQDLVVRVQDRVGVATGWLVLVGRGSSGPFERRYRYTDTWIKSGGRWRVFAAHDYLKP